MGSRVPLQARGVGARPPLLVWVRPGRGRCRLLLEMRLEHVQVRGLQASIP